MKICFKEINQCFTTTESRSPQYFKVTTQKAYSQHDLLDMIKDFDSITQCTTSIIVQPNPKPSLHLSSLQISHDTTITNHSKPNLPSYATKHIVFSYLLRENGGGTAIEEANKGPAKNPNAAHRKPRRPLRLLLETSFRVIQERR